MITNFESKTPNELALMIIARIISAQDHLVNTAERNQFMQEVEQAVRIYGVECFKLLLLFLNIAYGAKNSIASWIESENKAKYQQIQNNQQHRLHPLNIIAVILFTTDFYDNDPALLKHTKIGANPELIQAIFDLKNLYDIYGGKNGLLTRENIFEFQRSYPSDFSNAMSELNRILKTLNVDLSRFESLRDSIVNIQEAEN